MEVWEFVGICFPVRTIQNRRVSKQIIGINGDDHVVKMVT